MHLSADDYVMLVSFNQVHKRHHEMTGVMSGPGFIQSVSGRTAEFRVRLVRGDSDHYVSGENIVHITEPNPKVSSTRNQPTARLYTTCIFIVESFEDWEFDSDQEVYDVVLKARK